MSIYTPRNSGLLNPFGLAYDAFGRLRVGTPQTIFDSKLTHDNAPLFWTEGHISGSGISSSYLTNKASVRLTSSAGTAGVYARQTIMRFNYQPGKSQRILLTGVLQSSGGGTGVTSRFGYFDDNNGVFFQLKDGVFGVGVRSNATGTPVDTIVTSNNFNGDQIPEANGIALDDLSIDFTKTQIFGISFEWLGVGSVIFSVFQDAKEYILHVQHHANSLAEVYMSMPNLPVRYELGVTAEAVQSSIDAICSTVISEGGTQDTGINRYASTGGTHLTASTADTLYAVGGMRLRSTHLDVSVSIVNISILCETGGDFEWQWLLNPTVAGTFTYSGLTNSALELAYGVTANTITGGTALAGGFGSARIAELYELPNALRLGATVAGTADTLVLGVRPLANNQNIQAGITWRELL